MMLVRAHARHARVLVVSLLAFACDGAAAATAPDQATALATARSETITGGGGLSLSVHEAGIEGAPAIVLIHGFTQNSLTWDRQLDGLAERFHVIAYDLRGHGGSDKPLDAANYTDPSLWADDLDAIIRAKNLERPVLVGWSYGGFVIADYVRKFGDDGLGGLVFVGAITKNGTEEATGFLTDEVLGIFGDVLAPDVRTSLEATRALTRMFAGREPRKWEVAFGSAMMVPPEVRLGMFSRILDNDDVLAGIDVPTMVVHGAADRIVRLSAAQHTARMIPGAQLVVYDGVGHAPHLDAPARFNRDLAEFVRSIH